MPTVYAMVGADLFAGLVLVLWGLILWFGVSCNNMDHIRTYVVVPAFMLGAVASAVIIFNLFLRSPGLLAIFVFILMLPLFYELASLICAAAA